MLIKGLHGFGDNIYQRAFVRHFPDAYIETPFPELYQDLGIKCVRKDTTLRTQQKNIRQSSYQWHKAPAGSIIQVGYGDLQLRQGSIIDAMKRTFKVNPVFDLPDCGKSPVRSKKPIAVIRPVTHRKEWLNTARSPLPEYVCIAADILRQKGFHVVSIADVDGVNEWIEGGLPNADEYYHNGELTFIELLALVKSAAIVVGGVGWIVPACISAGTAGFFILGGNGAHNAPEKITSPEMDLSKIGWAKPDNFCMCNVKQHNCDKTIRRFDEKFRAFLDR